MRSYTLKMELYALFLHAEVNWNIVEDMPPMK